jgi:hypothetical protein
MTDQFYNIIQSGYYASFHLCMYTRPMQVYCTRPYTTGVITRYIDPGGADAAASRLNDEHQQFHLAPTNEPPLFSHFEVIQWDEP